ncbi:MAG: glycosyltransferase family 4 protein [Dolichospermum sp. WA123]|nr:glycosyltransferase family 4 protein [Dolichospermum sp. WA123]
MKSILSNLALTNNLPKIAIISPCLTDGDAVSNDVIGMYEVLSKNKYNVKVFAENWTLLNPQVNHVNKIKNFLNQPSDILIYHYSVGWDYGMNLLYNINCKKIIKYHNVTPPEFFEDICEDFVIACKAGREQLKNLVKVKGDLYIADSQYNLEELNSIAKQEKQELKGLVIYPFHHIDRLQEIEADLSILKMYKDEKVNILMVGRLAPNKGHLALISAFNVYHKVYNSNSRLIIVGGQDPRLSVYKQMLDNHIRSLNLQNSVVFAGRVSDHALKAYYLVSDVFMITSEHEGFCVPLIESMSMKIPIVAYGSTAIPYTLDKAGLVWKEFDPYLFAGSIEEILKDEKIKFGLGIMGWKRYQEYFTNSRIEKKFMEILQ